MADKRCFISLRFPEEINKKISLIQEKLPEFAGKKIEFENLHLTLKFLGEITDGTLRKVCEKLRDIEYPILNLEIDSLGVFDSDFIRIIWLNVKGAEDLQKKIDQNLSYFFDREKRFMGHLTIARVKSIVNKEKFLEELKKINFDKMKFSAGEFFLEESKIGTRGPIYEVLEKYKLKS